MMDFPSNRIASMVKHKFMQRLFFALIFFGFAICSGIVGFIIIEGFTLNEAFYMTIITISTVGYGEVRPLSDEGRVFVSLLIIFNIGALTYAVSVISTFIFEGDLKAVIKQNQMEQEIKKLSNHVIVCGYGRLGRIVCEDLEKEGRQILIVENNQKVIEELENKEKLYIDGDAAEDETILKMSVESASTIITTFHADANNIYVTLAARELNKDIKIISRASETANVSKLKLAGADHVIIPEDIGGSYIASMVSGKDAVKIGKWGY
jgi:voltage-gated potassium channel